MGGTSWQLRSASAKSLQSCPTLCDPLDCSPPGSSIHGNLQARILEWVAISSSRDRTRVSFGRQALYHSCHLGSPRNCLPMQGTWVGSLVQEDYTCPGATKPTHLQPVLWNKRSQCDETPTLSATREGTHAVTKTQCHQNKHKYSFLKKKKVDKDFWRRY